MAMSLSPQRGLLEGADSKTQGHVLVPGYHRALGGREPAPLHCAEMARLQGEEQQRGLGGTTLPWSCGHGLAREHFSLFRTKDSKASDHSVTQGYWGIWSESREGIRHSESCSVPRGLMSSTG